MAEDIKSRVQNIDPNVSARNIEALVKDTHNIYETLAIVTKRAKMLAVEIKQELHQKLDEFAVSSDTIEEINENKEQIEISKFYERLPNPVIIALDEFTKGELYYRYKEGSRDRDLEVE